MTLESRLEPCPMLLGMKTVSGNGEFWLDLNEELNSNLYQAYIFYNGLSYKGSTPDFGPGSPSSNLGSPTNKNREQASK